MRQILYVGNNLSTNKTNPSSIQVLGEALSKEGYRMYYTSSKRIKLVRLIDMLLTTIALRKKVDIVIIDTYSTINFYYALAVSYCCRLLNLSYIPILHGGNLESRLQKNPRMSRSIFKHAEHMVSPSIFLKKIFSNYNYKNVCFIPNSIELANYDFKLREIHNIKLMWVRSFSKIYNPTLAVEVLKLLLEEGFEASLCMVGPDSDGSFSQVESMAEQLGINVKFTGKLSKRDWHRLSKEYNIFINTTNFDNMPVSVIEAMALGMPIVSTNVGGMPYLIDNEKDGLLVEPNDAHAFVDAIKRLVNNPVLTKSMVSNARKKVEQFDWDIVRLKWHKVLD